MERLAQATAEAAERGETNIIPENFRVAYMHWLRTIRDWCVSRQLWWGHRLPVWFCQAMPEEAERPYIIAKEKPAACPLCGHCSMEQSEDVCDTWFSSALWPFAGLRGEDLKNYYPSQVLVTARDIINLWVGRMVFSGLEFRGAVPFKDVFIHATVLAKDGKRMSKSLGTGVDPMHLIETYGADATRFGIIWQATGGQDIRWDGAAVTAGKKFANKIWNAAKFALAHGGDGVKYNADALTAHDAEVIRKLEAVKKAVTEDIDQYRFGQALRAMYDFFWHDFCDVYLEAVKREKGSESPAVLMAALKDSLALLHPFMPFVTEAVWRALPGTTGLLITERWPA
jgi:valyl-tRNA synthetase